MEWLADSLASLLVVLLVLLMGLLLRAGRFWRAQCLPSVCSLIVWFCTGSEGFSMWVEDKFELSGGGIWARMNFWLRCGVRVKVRVGTEIGMISDPGYVNRVEVGLGCGFGFGCGF